MTVPRRALARAVLLPLVLTACNAAAPRALPTPSATPSRSPAPPADAEPFVVAVKGDWGAGTREQRAITAKMCELRPMLRFLDVLTTGDNFYSPDGEATPSNFVQPERCLVSYPGHRWRATWGNHDLRGRSTETELGAARYYTWSGGGADFFALDSNRAGDRAQRAWLVRALARSRARVKIAYFHHPPFTVGGHAGDKAVQREWVPLFERYGVTLVLSGHNHDYEHLRVRGVDYVVTGGGGATLSPCLAPRPELLRCTSRSHFLVVSIARARVTVHAVLSSGETLDRFTVDAGQE